MRTFHLAQADHSRKVDANDRSASPESACMPAREEVNRVRQAEGATLKREHAATTGDHMSVMQQWCSEWLHGMESACATEVRAWWRQAAAARHAASAALLSRSALRSRRNAACSWCRFASQPFLVIFRRPLQSA